MDLKNISIKHALRRKAKAGFIVAGLAVGVAAAVAVNAFIGAMTADIQHTMEHYGANILILPGGEDLQLSYGGLHLGGMTVATQPLRERDLERLATIADAASIAAIGPTLVGAVDAGGQKVLLAGIAMARMGILKPWWTVSGHRPGPDALLAGAQSARVLGLTIGRQLSVNGRPMTVAGILEPTGSQDDHLLFTELATAQRLLDQPDALSLVEVAALCNACPIDEMVGQIAAALPHARVTAIQQVVQGRMQTLHHFGRFSLGMAGGAILAGMLVVLTTMMASVRERREEIGIFRAMGFRKSQVMGIILWEAAILSAPAGLVGYLAGMGAAGLALHLSSGPGHASLAVDPALLVGAVALSLTVGLGASLYPAIAAARLDPNTALRSL